MSGTNIVMVHISKEAASVPAELVSGIKELQRSSISFLSEIRIRASSPSSSISRSSNTPYEDWESDELPVIKKLKEIYDCEKNISKLAFVVLEYLETHALLDQSVAILDYGCGNGDVAKFLSQKLNYALFTCIDISQEAINSARRNCESLPNFEFLCADVSAINQPYDIILLSSVYHFLNRKQRSVLISKVKRFLNPGGLLFLLTLSTDDQQYYGKGKPVTDVNDPNSFIYDEGCYLHFSSKNEFQNEFNFLKKERLEEFYGKNYTKDTEFFSCWIFTGKKPFNAPV